MKNLFFTLLSGQISVLKAKINQAIGLAVSKLANPKNVSLIEEKKDDIIAETVNFLPVQVKILYNLPFIKNFIDQETNDALEFLIRALKNANPAV